jgi:putative SOS response-associated peptidase YedK
MTTPNEVMRLLLYRKPVILPTKDYDQWPDYSVQELEPLLAILRPYPGEDLIAHPVSTRVNNPANDSSRCVLPLNA